MVIQRECGGCDKSFETHNNSNTCFDCTLTRITGGKAPKEGDFNTASILSGRLSPKEDESLRRELMHVECANPDEGESDYCGICENDPCSCHDCPHCGHFCSCGHFSSPNE
jgi:hypothetical protein